MCEEAQKSAGQRPRFADRSVVETAGHEAALHCHKSTPGGGGVVVAFKRGVCRPGWPRFVTARWWRLQLGSRAALPRW
jgi:hypothetical protein